MRCADGVGSDGGGVVARCRSRLWDEPAHDECAVLGVFAPRRRVGRMTLAGMIELNHRGQDSAGIAVSDGNHFHVAKGAGIAEVVFTFDLDVPDPDPEQTVLAVGHDRYSTSGGLSDAQPLEFNGLVIAHNGHLTNAEALRHEFPPPSVDGRRPVSDTAVALQVLANTEGRSMTESLLAGLRRLQGAYAMVLATTDTLYGVRDPHGFRPLALGRVEGGWALASETAAFPRMDATFEREVEPGEMVVIDDQGLRSFRLAPLSPPPPARCIFELIYVARPDSFVFGRWVEQYRRRTGEALARKAPVPADMVMAVPRSGIAATVGYAASSVARERGIPYGEGLITNAYASIATGFRTFIRPTGRDAAAAIKYNVIEPLVRDRDLIVIDDSVVRGSFRHVAAKLRACGARSIHLRIASPPLLGGCFYGVDFGDGELLANQITDHAARERWLGVDSLVHLSWDEAVRAALDTDLEPAGGDTRNVFLRHGFCGACFTREYPTEVDGAIAREPAVDAPGTSRYGAHRRGPVRRT